jgi:uncharacterized membrane protein (DUF485 family)
VTAISHPGNAQQGESVTQPERRLLTPEEYRAAQDSPEFTELRRRFRSFAVPMTVAFLLWYLLYVLLSSYAHGFMSTRVFGNVNIGLLFGLLQFVSTFVITQLYVRHAGRSTDPIADEMRERLEGHEYDRSRTARHAEPEETSRG